MPKFPADIVKGKPLVEIREPTPSSHKAIAEIGKPPPSERKPLPHSREPRPELPSSFLSPDSVGIGVS